MLLSIDGILHERPEKRSRPPLPVSTSLLSNKTTNEMRNLPPTHSSIPTVGSITFFSKMEPPTPESTSHRSYFYVGGIYVAVDENPGQRVMQGQMYVEQLTPLGGEPRRPLPLVFIHGGGQTASVRYVRSGFPFPFTTSNVVWICTSTCRRALLRIGIIISLAQNFLLKNSRLA